MTRLTQAGGAEAALIANGEPLPIGRLLEAAIRHGAIIGGNKKLTNFRSTVSKDVRFYSLMRNGMYFWWLNELPLPPEWSEATDPDLLAGSVASSAHSTQEGGDGHAQSST